MKRKNLMKFRIDYDLTQKQLADALGVTVSVVNHIELGKRDPSYSLLIKFKEVYGIDDVFEIFKKEGGK